MLASHHRFHGRNGLRRVLQNGSHVRSRSMLLRYSRRSAHLPPRLAIIVSKKIFKSAVKRNRVRRRLYEIVRHDMAAIPGGSDIIVTVFSQDVLIMPHNELVQETRRLLRPILAAASDTSFHRPR